MYKHILIPVVLGEGHDHEGSFAIARLLADADARFTVVYVREPIPGYLAAEIPDDVLDASRRGFEEDLQHLATALPGARSVILSGHAGRAIVDYANADEIDCIVLASHKPGPRNLFLGSTANRVVHEARCAVHVIR